MSFRLIGQWHSVSVEFGGLQTGAPDWDDPVILLGKRSTETDERMNTADVTALEDPVTLTQIKNASATVTLEFLVEGAMKFVAKRGHYCRVTIKPLSAGVASEAFAGVITGRTVRYPDGETVERVTLTVGANGIAYP